MFKEPCHAASLLIRLLRHLRRYVTNDYIRAFVVSPVHSRLDYDYFVIVRLSASLQRRLQALLNAAARLVFRTFDFVATTM